MIAARPQHQRHADLLAASATPRSSRPTCAGSSGSSRAAATRAGVASVASFFVSRVDTEADKRLDEVGAPDELQGQARDREREARLPALQGALLRRALGGARARRARRTQRCLWASTSTKNPAYRDVLYVEELIGPETVNTMPEETIEAFQDHGEVALTLERDLDEAKQVFERVAEAGVDYDDVVVTLEREGVQKFSDSFSELLDGVQRQARRARLGLRPLARGDLRRGRRRGAGDRPRARGHLRQPHVGPAVGALHARVPRAAAATCAASAARRSSRAASAHARDLVERARAARVRAGGARRRLARRPRCARGGDRTARARLRARARRAGPARPRLVRRRCRTRWGEEEAALEAGDLDSAVEVNLRTWVDGPRREPEDVDPAVRARVARDAAPGLRAAAPVRRGRPRKSCSCRTSPTGSARCTAPTLILSSATRMSRTCTRSPSGSSARFPVRGARRSRARRTCRAWSGPREFDELVLAFLREPRVSTVAPAELVARIWERDPTLWTGKDEAKWLGWLDEPMRMRSRLADLAAVRRGRRRARADRHVRRCSGWAARASRPR